MPRVTFDSDFTIGQIVWHRLDNSKGIVTMIRILPDGLMYGVNWGPMQDDICSALEISSEPSPEWADEGPGHNVRTEE